MQRTLIAASIGVLSFLSAPARATELTLRPGITIEVPPAWTSSRDTATTWLLERHNDPFVDAMMSITVEDRDSHAEAVQQLAAIDAEYDAPATWSANGAWPMLERKVEAPAKTPDPLEDPSEVRPVVIPDDGLIVAWRATTAAAPGPVVVRMHTVLRPNADPALADEALAIGRTLKLPAGDATAGAADVQQLQAGSLRPQPIDPAPVAKKSGDPGATGTTGTNGIATKAPRRVVLVAGEGEIEVAIGNNGTSIVAVAGGTVTYSNNGGTSFARSTLNEKGSKATDGDLSVAWGPSGNFYYTQLGSKLVSCFRSTDQGANFTYLSKAVNQKPDVVPPNGRSVDQEHIAADRFNQTKGKDRLYMVFQEGGHLVTRLNCSKDSGATWSIPIAAASGDDAFPRVSVGRDGMVYTVSRAGNLVVIDKFSDCASNLTHQSRFPVRVQIRNVKCPVAGLDRCNNGNTLASPTIAVDDLDAKHVYLAFATSNADRSAQNIAVIQSTDGGKTFDPNGVAVNGGGPAIRFMPWIVVSNGIGYVGWYDRRNISPMRNDKTSYYKNSVSVVNGRLMAGTEENLSGGLDDLQCNGWPRAPRAKRDATACTKQPQLAGFCLPSTARIRCDYGVTPSTCPASTKCLTGSGLPKYGDYNGLATGGGKLVNVWAATVPPAGAPGVRTLDNTSPRVWATVTSVP